MSRLRSSNMGLFYILENICMHLNLLGKSYRKVFYLIFLCQCYIYKILRFFICIKNNKICMGQAMQRFKNDGRVQVAHSCLMIGLGQAHALAHPARPGKGVSRLEDGPTRLMINLTVYNQDSACLSTISTIMISICPKCSAKSGTFSCRSMASYFSSLAAQPEICEWEDTSSRYNSV